MVVDNSSGLLRPGLTANADIVVAELEDALFVPNGALRFTPRADDVGAIPPHPGPVDGNPSGRVWALEGGTPIPRDLVLGRSDGQLTEVVAGDLEAGEEVIVDFRDSTPR